MAQTSPALSDVQLETQDCIAVMFSVSAKHEPSASVHIEKGH